MTFDPLSQSSKDVENKPIYQRLLWLLLFWLMGVATISVVGYIIRLWVKA
ncbi:DUF2474 domain-containing protein [Sphingorhabdus lutea]|nr:DUF2474 domain-containing protein [Sphingorhabdus lutea]